MVGSSKVGKKDKKVQRLSQLMESVIFHEEQKELIFDSDFFLQIPVLALLTSWYSLGPFEFFWPSKAYFDCV